MQKIALSIFLLGTYSMHCNNAETICSYEAGFQSYIDKTPQEVDGIGKKWIEQFLSYVPHDNIIWEIGSGFGRDSKFIESLGYSVHRSDATLSFVKYLHDNGFACRSFNILVDDFDEPLFAVFANAVFLHFTREEFRMVLNKIYSALEVNGILSFSLKCGYDEEWEQGKLAGKRFFCYWQPLDVRALLIKSNFEVVSLEQDNEKKWIYIIARK